MPWSIAAWPRASRRWVLPVPEGPQTTRFSCRSIHSRVPASAGSGRGSSDTFSSQVSKVLPVGNPARGRRVLIEDAAVVRRAPRRAAPARLRRVPSVAPWRWRARRGRGDACAAGAAGAAARRPRRPGSTAAVRRSSPITEAVPGAGAGLQRVGVVGALRSAITRRGGRRGSTPRRRRRSGRRWRRGRAPSRPASAPCRRASVTASAIFTFTRAVPAAAASSSHIRAPSPSARNSASAAFVARGLPVERPGRAGRVVGVIDAWRAWRGAQVAGHLDRAGRADVGGDHLVTVDPDPHLGVDQRCGTE